MIKKIEHLGIAVKDLNKSNELFKKLLGEQSYKTEAVDSESVTTSFFKVGDQKIELLEASEPNSTIARFIERRGEGMHHLAFHVENIDEEIERLEKEGFEFVSKTPIKGADNKMVVFLHPKTTNGVLIELCQDID